MKLALSPARRLLLGLGTVGLAAAGLATLAPTVGTASAHREAPLIAGQPRLDNTDLYAFVSPDATNTVTMIANWTPFEEPNGGPNLYPFVVDTALADPDLNVNQTYKLRRIAKPGTKTLVSKGKVAPSFTGKASTPDDGALSAQAVTPLPGGGKSFAGRADDPFFLDLRVFDLLYGGNLSAVGRDTLAGYHVNSIAIQVPKADLALRGNVTRNPVVGIWTTTSRSGAEVTENANNVAFPYVALPNQDAVNQN
jgi:hypothetical protein